MAQQRIDSEIRTPPTKRPVGRIVLPGKPRWTVLVLARLVLLGNKGVAKSLGQLRWTFLVAFPVGC